MKQSNFYLLIIVAIVVLWLTREVCGYYSNKQLSDKLINYQDSTTHYKLKLKNKDSVTVATNEAIALYTSKQLQDLASKKDAEMKQLLHEFKTTIAAIKLNSTANVTEHWYYYADSVKIPCDFKPIPVVIDSPMFKIGAQVENEKFQIKYLILHDTERIVIGEKRTGFLKRQTRVDVTHSNKFINTKRINAYVVDQKWWQNKAIVCAASFASGAVTTIITQHFIKNGLIKVKWH